MSATQKSTLSLSGTPGPYQLLTPGTTLPVDYLGIKEIESKVAFIYATAKVAILKNTQSEST